MTKETVNQKWEKDKSIQSIIVGRQEPKIYAFSTKTVPSYLKIGDTYRLLSVRLDEWKKYFEDLKEEFGESAMVSKDVYFRDYAVHDYLENALGKHRLRKNEAQNLSMPYYSNEFFKDTSVSDIELAIKDIKKQYKNNSSKYQYYDAEKRLPKQYKPKRNITIRLRDEQKTVIDNFKKAYENKRTDLLLYAVMRFGKSVVAMYCAKEMKANIILIVSAKADVGEEWRDTVGSIIGFEKYEFVDAEKLRDKNVIKNIRKRNKKAVIFLTLQDLNGKTIKEKHKELFENTIDLVIIDETHFGAWAENYGKILRNTRRIREPKDNREGVSDEKEFRRAEEVVKELNVKVKLHLSGTPYRILLEHKFNGDDVIGFYQLSDIESAKKAWQEKYFQKIESNAINKDTCKPYQEWDNPYYGFPQMIRFAFNPNESSIAKLSKLKENGIAANLSDLFMPLSIKKDDKNGNHKKFKNEVEILDLMKAIDGAKEDKNILSFLNDNRIKDGNMCRHIVIVLPYRASCDALEALIKTHKKDFLNLKDYKIINISGVDNDKQYKTIASVKSEIQNCEEEEQKTITLTVNRMLTGVTVEEWDTMIFLKSLSSPQEYDQAIFRIQNQFIKRHKSKNGDVSKKDMKPQTLLVDFEPIRMFRMQESKAQIYNWYEEKNGNAKLRQRLENDLSISPIIYFNTDKIQQVSATDLMKQIMNYSGDTSILDELKTLNIDTDIYENPELKKIIDEQPAFGSKGFNFETKANDGNETELDIPEVKKKDKSRNEDKTSQNNDIAPEKEENQIRLKIETYYSRILFYAFLTQDDVSNITDIIKTIQKPSNIRLAKNVGIDKQTLTYLVDAHINSPGALSQLEYKIQKVNELSNDQSKSPEERMQIAIRQFNKLSDSEVITPQEICEKMVKELDDSIKKGKILDVASKAGEFAIATCKAMKRKGISEKIIKNSIYSIPTSKIAYEFTRKMYEAFGLNTDNIAKKFTAYDIIKGTPENAKNILYQNKVFSEIELNIKKTKKGDKPMKFAAVVGNPPYQEIVAVKETKNGQKCVKNIFQTFQDRSEKIANVVELIYPAKRWIHRAGKGMQKFGLNQINDSHLSKLIVYPDASELFPTTEIGDGISIVVKDMNANNSSFEYIYREGGKEVKQRIAHPGTKLMPIHPYDSVITTKINTFVKKYNLEYLHKNTLPRSLFGIESDYIEKNKTKCIQYVGQDFDSKKLIKAFTNDKAGKAGRAMWFLIPRKDIPATVSSYIGEWQVVVSSAAAGGQKRGSQMDIVDNQSVFGRSRVALKSFKSKTEAINFQKYCKTNIVKYLFLLTDESLNSVAKWVPDLLSYGNNGLLNFSKDIDAQLKQLMCLTDNEFKYIQAKSAQYKE